MQLRLKGVNSFPTTLSDEEKEDTLERAHSAILLCLFDEVLREVEATAPALWLKLEKLYMKKIPYQSVIFEAATIHSPYV